MALSLTYLEGDKPIQLQCTLSSYKVPNMFENISCNVNILYMSFLVWGKVKPSNEENGNSLSLPLLKLFEIKLSNDYETYKKSNFLNCF